MKAVAREPDAMNTPLQQRKNTNHVSAGLSFKCICWLRPEHAINSFSTRWSSQKGPGKWDCHKCRGAEHLPLPLWYTLLIQKSNKVGRGTFDLQFLTGKGGLFVLYSM